MARPRDPTPLSWFLPLWTLNVALDAAWFAFQPLPGALALPLAVVALWRGGLVWHLAVWGVGIAHWAIWFPETSNHGFVTTAGSVLFAAVLLARRGAPERAARDVGTLAAGIAAVTYGAALLQKLNHAYLDPVQSCAVGLWHHRAGQIGLDALLGSALDPVMPALSLLGEAALAVLVVVPRLRVAGLLLAILFHGVVGFDLDAPIFLFSLTMLALFVGAAHGPHPARAPGRWVFPILGGITAVVGLAGLPGQVGLHRQLLTLVWLALSIVVVLGVVAPAREDPPREPLRPSPLTAALVGAFAVLAAMNTATAHLGWKEINSFDMYANLVVEPGRSNHLFLPSLAREAPWRRTVVVEEADVPGLGELDAPGGSLATLEVDRALQLHGEGTVRVVGEGEAWTAETPRTPWWRRKLHKLRPSRSTDPCTLCAYCVEGNR